MLSRDNSLDDQIFNLALEQLSVVAHFSQPLHQRSDRPLGALVVLCRICIVLEGRRVLV